MDTLAALYLSFVVRHWHKVQPKNLKTVINNTGHFKYQVSSINNTGNFNNTGDFKALPDRDWPSRLPCYVFCTCLLTNKNTNANKLSWAINYDWPWQLNSHEHNCDHNQHPLQCIDHNQVFKHGDDCCSKVPVKNPQKKSKNPEENTEKCDERKLCFGWPVRDIVEMEYEE